MVKKIKVLFLEDNPDDVELELYELRKGGFEVEHAVARDRREFLAVLEDLDADIIIADYSLPDLTGIEAIHICRQRDIRVPVILITGMGNEQIAVDSLREGAIDYILKRNIAGFAVRVSRALDIWTDRQAVKTAEEEKLKLQQQLFQAQKMESVGRLAGGIAHDFNNLLTGIMGYASLSLRVLQEESPIRNNLQAIVDVSQRASDLVKQLLLFSKKIPLELKVVDLNRLIEENVKFIRRMVEETVEIRLELEKGLPEIKSDEGQLTQVLVNFAVNARDAMEGEGTLLIKSERFDRRRETGVLPAALDGDEFIRISISDTGCGIDAKDVPRIFDPFFTTKEVGKGTGLGLATVYSIVSGHGGWVDVESEKGHGSTFRIYLPVHISEDDTRPMISSSLAESALSMISGTETILIVEDEDMLRSFTVNMLTDLGYTVLAAGDGDEALDVYRRHEENVDLVISDMIMPNKSGMELFRELKQLDPAVKFILVTGYCLEEVEGHILRDMEAILMKPYTTEKIAALIRKVIDGQ